MFLFLLYTAFVFVSFILLFHLDYWTKILSHHHNTFWCILIIWMFFIWYNLYKKKDSSFHYANNARNKCNNNYLCSSIFFLFWCFLKVIHYHYYHYYYHPASFHFLPLQWDIGYFSPHPLLFFYKVLCHQFIFLCGWNCNFMKGYDDFSIF